MKDVIKIVVGIAGAAVTMYASAKIAEIIQKNSAKMTKRTLLKVKR